MLINLYNYLANIYKAFHFFVNILITEVDIHLSMMAISVTSVLYVKYSFRSEQPKFLCSLERNLLPLKLMYFMKGDLMQGAGSLKTICLIDEQTCQPPDTRSWTRWPDLLLLGSLIRDCVRIHSYPLSPLPACSVVQMRHRDTADSACLCAVTVRFSVPSSLLNLLFPVRKRGQESWQLCWKLSSW